MARETNDARRIADGLRGVRRRFKIKLRTPPNDPDDLYEVWDDHLGRLLNWEEPRMGLMDEEEAEERWMYHDEFWNCVTGYLERNYSQWLAWGYRPFPKPFLVLVMRWPGDRNVAACKAFVKDMSSFALRFARASEESQSRVEGWVVPINLESEDERMMPPFSLDCTVEAMVLSEQISLTAQQKAEIFGPPRRGEPQQERYH